MYILTGRYDKTSYVAYDYKTERFVKIDDTDIYKVESEILNWKDFKSGVCNNGKCLILKKNNREALIGLKIRKGEIGGLVRVNLSDIELDRLKTFNTQGILGIPDIEDKEFTEKARLLKREEIEYMLYVNKKDKNNDEVNNKSSEDIERETSKKENIDIKRVDKYRDIISIMYCNDRITMGSLEYDELKTSIIKVLSMNMQGTKYNAIVVIETENNYSICGAEVDEKLVTITKIREQKNKNVEQNIINDYIKEYLESQRKNRFK